MKNQKLKIYKLFVPLMVEKEQMTENSRVTKRLEKKAQLLKKVAESVANSKKPKYLHLRLIKSITSTSNHFGNFKNPATNHPLKLHI